MVETSSLITHPVTDDERLVHHKLDLLLRTGCILVENAADTSRIIRTMKRVAMHPHRESAYLRQLQYADGQP